LRRVAGLEILTAKKLELLPWVVHGFSTRKGGASRLDGIAALNLGFTQWDSRASVARNRRAFTGAIRATDASARLDERVARPESLVSLRQIHSDIVHVFSKAPARPPQGDAAICRRPELLLGIQTADCVPILLADARRRVVAAVHAGWRGTLARIATKTLGRMRLEFGTQPEDVLAALGPAIGPCCYEVGPEVALAFAGQFAHAAEWFEGPFERLATGEEPNPLPWLTMMPPGHEPPPERVRLDLRAANRWQLIDAGVSRRNIAVSSLCTGCRTDLFFSYRKEGPGAGRMMSVIGIRANAR
jgi:purine-nucleoside/S-methyl-5'-thioadenosine phosphorylase / adenosine deaminase